MQNHTDLSQNALTPLHTLAVFLVALVIPAVCLADDDMPFSPSIKRMVSIDSGFHDNPTDEEVVVHSHEIYVNDDTVDLFLLFPSFELSLDDGSFLRLVPIEYHPRFNDDYPPKTLTSERFKKYDKHRIYSSLSLQCSRARLELVAGPHTKGNRYHLVSIRAIVTGKSAGEVQRHGGVIAERFDEEKDGWVKISRKNPVGSPSYSVLRNKDLCPFGSRTDTRVLSSEPAIARLQMEFADPRYPKLRSPFYGTAFMVGCESGASEEDRCFVSAGHNFEHPDITDEEIKPVSVKIQFDVPPSMDCERQSPIPEKEFELDRDTLQKSAFPSVQTGKDWAVFRAKAHGTTGKTPFQEQRAALSLYPTDLEIPVLAEVAVTGYSRHNGNSDPNQVCGECDPENPPPSDSSRHNVQQTASGLLTPDPLENAIGYEVDTCGGSSGSPIVLKGTCQALATHSRGRCQDTAHKFNIGTAITHPELRAALEACMGNTTPAQYTAAAVEEQVDVAMFDDGRFVVVWQPEGLKEIRMRLFDGLGRPAAYDVLVASSGQSPSVAAWDNGFLVVYEDDSLEAVFARRYNLFAQLIESIEVTDEGFQDFEADVAAWADGRFVVVTTGPNPDFAIRTRAHFFDKDGNLVSGNILIGIIRRFKVVSASDGGFFVAWDDSFGGEWFINLRKYNQTGLGTDIDVDETPFNTPPDFSITAAGDRILVAWRRSFFQGQLRKFLHSGAPATPVLENPNFSGYLVAGSDDGSFVLASDFAFVIQNADLEIIREQELLPAGAVASNGRGGYVLVDHPIVSPLPSDAWRITASTCNTSADPTLCVAPPDPTIFADGFESGNVSNWSSSVGLI